MGRLHNNERHNLLQHTTERRNSHYGFYAVDLHTGQQIWYNNGTNPITMAAYTGAGGVDPAISQTYPKLSCGQMVQINNVNGRGIASYLWEQGPATSADRAGLHHMVHA